MIIKSSPPINTEEKAFVTIGVLVYNTENYIESCLKSIFNQTFKNIELIIVYTKSSDNTLQKLNDSIQSCPYSYKIIESTKDQIGPGPCRNIVLDQVISEYLFFLDSDDTITEDCIDSLLIKAVNFNLDMVCGSHLAVSESGVNMKSHSFKEEKLFLGHALLRYIHLENQQFPIYCWNKLYRTSVLKKNNIIFSQNYAEDVLFIYKVILACSKSMVVENVTLKYLIRSTSLTNSTMLNQTNHQTAIAYSEIRKYKFETQLTDYLLYGAIVLDTFFTFFILINRDVIRSPTIDNSLRLMLQKKSFMAPSLRLLTLFELALIKPRKLLFYMLFRLTPNWINRIIVRVYLRKFSSR